MEVDGTAALSEVVNAKGTAYPLAIVPDWDESVGAPMKNLSMLRERR